MQSSLHKIILHLKCSKMSREDRHRLVGYLSMVGESHLRGIFELFLRDSKAPQFMLENMTRKHQAILDGDRGALMSILDEEKKIITQ